MKAPQNFTFDRMTAKAGTTFNQKRMLQNLTQPQPLKINKHFIKIYDKINKR